MRFLTYNIHKGIGGRDRRYELERVIDVIAGEQPDVVCLQEVDRHVKRSRFDDQPHILAERLGFEHLVYQPTHHLKHGCYGNLVLSRWPFFEHHHISLRLKTKKQRGAQLALIDAPTGKFFLANFHLGLAEKERHWQIGHFFGHHLVRPLLRYPTVILGDTNDWRNTLHKRELAMQRFSLATHPISRFRTFPAWMPLGSLDKVFHNGGVEVSDARVIKTKLSRAASDHLPLVVRIELNAASLAPA